MATTAVRRRRGMVLKPSVFAAIENLRVLRRAGELSGNKRVLLSTREPAEANAREEHGRRDEHLLICGRYEGVTGGSTSSRHERDIVAIRSSGGRTAAVF